MSQRKLTAEQVINQRNQFEWIPVLLKKEKPFKRYVKLIRDDNPLIKKSIRESERLARRALKKSYVPLYSGTYFQSKSEGVPKWYTNPMYCGDLVFNNSARD